MRMTLLWSKPNDPVNEVNRKDSMVMCTPNGRYIMNPKPSICSRDDFCTQQVSFYFWSTVFFRYCSISYIHRWLHGVFQMIGMIDIQARLSYVQRMIQSVHYQYNYLCQTWIESFSIYLPFRCKVDTCSGLLGLNGS